MEIKKEHILAPYVSTDPIVARYMIELANPNDGDMVLDIGCGERGTILIEASKNPKIGKVVGIEYDDERVKKVIHNVRDLGLEDKVEIIHDDVFNVDLSEIDPAIVTLYLTYTGICKLKSKLENELRSGTRVVSSAFEVDEWEPLRSVRLKYKSCRCSNIFFYKIGETDKKGVLHSLKDILINRLS